MADEGARASRRDVLRGSAIGMSALVGAMAVTSSTEVAAEAAGTRHNLTITFGGIAPKNLPLGSVNFGGDNPGGTPTPDVVTLSLPTGAHSPFLLKSFAQETTRTVTIRGYGTDASGRAVIDYTITFTAAEVVHYHLAGSPTGATDQVQLRFGSVQLEWNPQNVQFTWTPVA
jgi:type VI protein secretion system component Hcp